MTKPPFTPMTCPVIKADPSSASHRMVRATSSGVPMLPKGVSSRRAASVSGSKASFISVAMTPGATQFTRMPLGPSSLASALVKPMTAAFAAE